jgi:DNA polymerase III subunit delta
MAKKPVIQSILEITKYLSEGKYLPIYFFCGEDDYSLDLALKTVEKSIAPQILSEFDKEVINAEKNQNLSQILDTAFSFPLGGGKKLIILNNFDKINDKKELKSYIDNPPEFTILLITQRNKITDISKEPYLKLKDNGYLFEARPASGDELVDWLVKKSKKIGMTLSQDNAQALIEITGENKALLEIQLQKIQNYLGKREEINYDDITKISSTTKEFSIFELQYALGIGEKTNALKIAFSLLDSGVDIVFIINMLSKFVLSIAQITELSKLHISDFEAPKLAGISYGYYINCKKARFLMSDKKLLNSSRALLSADLAVKTSVSDPKSIMSLLISRMMGESIASDY